VFHEETDNVLHLCTKWNKHSCAFGETTTQSSTNHKNETHLTVKADALADQAQF
jgi:hypothetical protein